MTITMIVDRDEIEDLLDDVFDVQARLNSIFDFYRARFEENPDAMGSFELLELEVKDMAEGLFKNAKGCREKYFGG